MRKYIFVTGGVLSSVGKGVTTAALGLALKEYGFRVAAQKLDPYLNVDPGTMSPYQHGEVFVLDDGAETDLDLGHYERFMDVRLNRMCNVTTGQVYAEIIAKERRGDFLGGTIQVIPHITNEIKRRIALVGETLDADIVIVEVGGTVGDYESVAFLEAIRQMRNDVGRENTAYIHVTWLPFIRATGELKTKPTQHSVRELRSVGIAPDMIIPRSDHPVAPELIDKIALFCDVEPRAVVPLVTVDVLYEVPLILERAGVARYLLERLHLEPRRQPDWSRWQALVEKARAPKPKLPIALVGKYVELRDAYMSVKEALVHAGLHLGVEVDIAWVQASDLEKNRPEAWEAVRNAAGVLVPGGFDSRGVEGKILAARYARENRVPYFGLCLGMQLMVVEFARHVLGYDDAHSTEFDPGTEYPVIDLMPDQRSITDMGGTMRLGLYPCVLQPGTKARAAYGDVDVVEERHRHRFEFNNAYRAEMQAAGMVFSGLSPDGRLVEIAELRDHPFMLGTQFHPEFLSRPIRPHPLFVAFLRAARAYAQARGSGEPTTDQPAA